ncbi:MAG TPA: 3-hydroxyacyl-CoA dehydrogenase NAD-binding domain-containing protein [Pirellulales bacterium]|nr:3-hydroxyacyl-CoA dehydrogenase NAD-binding domain-containing protein [Pirellulales bacterium]
MATAPIIQLSFPEPDIAQLTLDDPSKGANVLSTPVLAEFAAHLDQLERRPGLAGLVIRSGKPGSFIAGADLREFVASLDAPKDQIVAMCHRGRRLFERLSKGSFVTVAAIDGVCLGGGAELSIWCDRRIMATDPKAQFGFPEVKLGLYPGWGGTARSSRIVGLANAVELVTSGESIDGRAAVLMGLATDVVPADRIGAAAIALIRAEQTSKQYLEDRVRWRQPLEIDETELTFLGATASALIQQQTKGHYPAPVAALELMLEAAALDIESACTKEAEGMAELFGSPVNRALINVFFLGDRNKKDVGIARADVKPRPIKSVSVIGAGIMGRGIAAANLKRNIHVRITDAAAAALDAGVEQTLEEASFDRQTKRPDPKRAVHFASILHATTSDDELAASDLVIEAVVEIPDVKRAVFARLEPRLRPEAILATNTSTIPISQLAQKLTHPDRFCGIHFFNPVRKMPLVEVIRGERTSDETVATAVAYAKTVGKSPVVVNDGPGFLVNRLLFFYMLEALELLSAGAEIKAIERAAKNFGMPMGPLALYDVVGFDTAVLAGRVMYDAYPDRIVLSPIVGALMKAGRLGQKSGAGFFSYARDKERGEPDPRVLEILAPYLRKQEKFTSEQLTSRLFLPMLLEATRVLQEGLVRDPRDVDLALIYGIGFPPFKGGLLFWADTLGVERILKMLDPLESLGPRMAPTGLLVEMGKTGRRFYQPGA